MKLIAFLGLFLVGCATSGTPARNLWPTLEVYNNSGSSARVLLSYQGREYIVGSAWPGKSCFKLSFVPRTASVAFGIRHIAETRPIWSSALVPLSDDSGWYLEINQPSQAIFDLNNLRFVEKC